MGAASVPAQKFGAYIAVEAPGSRGARRARIGDTQPTSPRSAKRFANGARADFVRASNDASRDASSARWVANF
jgi:hypothetical protein